MIILNELLNEKGSEREKYLASLGPWSDDIRVVETEGEIVSIFQNVLSELTDVLGNPVYSGTGNRHDGNFPEPRSYFDSTESALQLAWWECYGGEVALFHTGHDANTLQFVVIAISDDCIDSIA